MDLTRTLLEWMTINGPLTLGLVAFICALGVPLPIPLLMLAAGALVRQGQMDLPMAILVTGGGVLMAELLYYAIGRELGPVALARAGERFARAYDQAESRFRLRPGLTVYLTRWLFAPIAVPVNLIAGSSGFPLGRFVLSSIIGDTMWILGYTTVGYVLGSEWHNVSPVLDRYKVYFAGAGVLVGFALLGWRKREAVGRAVRPALVAAAAAFTPKKPVAEPIKVTDTKNSPRR